MAVHELRKTQFIQKPLDEVWRFFSNPLNLSAITPGYMQFTVTSEIQSGEIYPGQVITYKVSPLLGIPLFWMTEITHVLPRRMFVDEQRKGPYKLWHHQHHFEEKGDGVLMTDIVHYEAPFWVLGDLATRLFLKSQLEDIFEFRRNRIDEIFH